MGLEAPGCGTRGRYRFGREAALRMESSTWRDTAWGMSEENVEIIRRAYEAYDRGDRDAFVADIAPECEYVAAGTVPGRTGSFRGPEGYKKFVAWLDEEFSDAQAKLDAIIDAGDSVVVGATLRGRGRQSGIPATFTFWQVWAFANGQIVGGQGFANKAQALEAAGLRE